MESNLNSILLQIEDFRTRLKKFMAKSTAGQIYNQFFLFLSLFSACTYIYVTYLLFCSDTENDCDVSDYETALQVEKSLAIAFVLDWFLYFIIADSKLAYITSFFPLVDVCTILPVLITSDKPRIVFSSISSLSDALLFSSFVLNATQIIRALRLRKLVFRIEDNVKRVVAEYCLIIAIFTMFNAGVMQVLESEIQPLTFLTWTYFTTVTLSTLGYGDIAPKSQLGRIYTMVVIAATIVTVPGITTEILDKMNMQSKYARRKYSARGFRNGHVIICGNTESTNLPLFFDQLFHTDHDGGNLDAVILSPKHISDDLLLTMKNPRYYFNVCYLEGSPFLDRDLKRAKAEEASAIFFLSNKFTGDADEEDAKIVLQYLSFKRYLQTWRVLNQRSKNKKTEKFQYFCVQLLKPENKPHLAVAFEKSNSQDLVICMNEMKMGLIAKSVILPGTITLLMNLITNYRRNKDNDVDSKTFDLDRNMEEDTSNSSSEDQAVDKSEWFSEYETGCEWEIFLVALAHSFEGCQFIDVSKVFYSEYGIILFALQVQDKAKQFPSRMLLNPEKFEIPSQRDYKIEAFVIATSRMQADMASEDLAYKVENRKASFMENFREAVSEDALSSETGEENETSSSSHIEIVAMYSKSPAVTQDNPIHRRGTVLQKRARPRSIIFSKREKIDLEALLENERLTLDNDFFIAEDALLLSDVVITTSLSKEHPEIHNHIIILTTELTNIYDLIKPLRAKSIESLKPIVILHQDEISPSMWQRISIFPDIYLVKGSPMEQVDICRAGVFKAHTVVILSAAQFRRDQDEFKNRSLEQNQLIDADALFTFKNVKLLNHEAHVIVELVQMANLMYFDIESGITNPGRGILSPTFASSSLYMTSAIDALLCKSYYTPQILKILNLMISGRESSQDSTIMIKKKNDYLASINCSSLYQLSPPSHLDTYGAVFNHFADQGIIAFGIFRERIGNQDEREMNFVFTNPSKDTNMFSSDKIFVLSPKLIQNKNMTSVKARKASVFGIPANAASTGDCPENIKFSNLGINKIPNFAWGLEDIVEEDSI